MELSLDDLALIYPDQVLLKFSHEEREQAWQQTQRQRYSNPSAQWNAYLNCLCLNTFLTYLETEPDLPSTPQVWTGQADLPSLWQVVNGTAIDIDQKRLVLIPSEKSDYTEFRIPREWVDLPNWSGNYYLAVQLNLEECWMQVWGYAPHHQLRYESRYDRMDETYSLEAQELAEDLIAMWTAWELYPGQRPEVEPLPSLSPDRAEALIEQLSKESSYSPRLDVPFAQWGSLMAEDRWRRSLYERQHRQLVAQAPAAPAINVRQWFGEMFEAGWQSLESLLGTQPELSLAYSFRQGQSAERPLSVEGVKLIDLGVQLGNQSVALLIGFTPEAEQTSIRVQLHPAGGATTLPPNIKLALLSRSGKVLQELRARSQDNLIQLKRFTCPVGKRFTIQVALDNFSLTEDFVVELPEREL